jgi:uncharacterized protein (TIGR02118 family)
MIKSVSLLVRKPDMTVEAFRKVWLEEHAPMVRSVPEVRRYVLSFPLAEPTRPDVPAAEVRCDAIAELWYDDMASLQKASASAAMKKVTDNGALYLGSIKTFVMEEVGIIT